MKKELMLCVALLVSVSAANAVATSSGAVERFYPNDGTSVYFRLTGDACNISLDNCDAVHKAIR